MVTKAGSKLMDWMDSWGNKMGKGAADSTYVPRSSRKVAPALPNKRMARPNVAHLTRGRAVPV
jgi:hypothetical protein